MTKTINKGLFLVGVLVVGGIICGNETALAAPEDVPVSVVLTSTLTLGSTELNFGELDYTPAGGSIILNAAGAVSTAATFTAPTGLFVSDATNALFGSVTIDSDATFDVTAAYADASLVTTPANATTLTVTDVATYSDTTVSVAGVATQLYVGGQLNVPTNAEDGTYEGDIVVTLTYTNP